MKPAANAARFTLGAPVWYTGATRRRFAGIVVGPVETKHGRSWVLVKIVASEHGKPLDALTEAMLDHLEVRVVDGAVLARSIGLLVARATIDGNSALARDLEAILRTLPLVENLAPPDGAS